jgi:hypothetical protein
MTITGGTTASTVGGTTDGARRRRRVPISWSMGIIGTLLLRLPEAIRRLSSFEILSRAYSCGDFGCGAQDHDPSDPRDLPNNDV